MYFKKEGYPEEHDLVLCTVERITPNSVFVTLDDHGHKEGLIHVSEIAPGRIRNIRDFVKEKHKVVCLVLTSNKERNLIDLSVRRVSLQNRMAVEEWHKQEMIAEKLLDHIAKTLKMEGKDLYEKVGKQLVAQFGSVFKAFQEVSNKGADFLKVVKADKKVLDQIVLVVRERIKRPEVKIDAVLNIHSFAADGVDRVRSLLMKVLDAAQKSKWDISFHYVGAPSFKTVIVAPDFKSAEKVFEGVEALMRQDAKKSEVQFEFIREKK